MAKKLVIGDLHLKNWSDTVYDGYVSLKVREILDAFKQMCDYAVEHNIDTVTVLGDVNDTKAVASVLSFLMFGDLLCEYPQITFEFIPGNHDMTGNSGRSAVELLKHVPNAKLYIKPTIVDNMVYLPYSKTIMEDINNLLDTCDSKPNLLFGHFGLSDAQLSTGISLKTSISLKDLTMFDLVLCGHYHKPQELNKNGVRLLYVGSPIQLRRDEKNEEKRFLVVDTETLEVQSISTDGYRKYIQLVIDENTDLKQIEDDIANYKKDGHFVYVRNLLEQVPKLPEGVFLIDDYQPEFQSRGLTASMSEEERLNKWLEIQRVLDKDRDLYFKLVVDALDSDENDDEWLGIIDQEVELSSSVEG